MLDTFVLAIRRRAPAWPEQAVTGSSAQIRTTDRRDPAPAPGDVREAELSDTGRQPSSTPSITSLTRRHSQAKSGTARLGLRRFPGGQEGV